MQLSQEQIKANIDKLREKMGDARTGGKGTQRRKVKVISKTTNGSNDKIVKTLVKKMGAQPLGVDQVNFFLDDNTVLHFTRPETYASIQSNTFIVSGQPETKTIKDLLPDIIQQLGPKQHQALKELVSASLGPQTQEIPTLVESTPKNIDTVQ